MSEPQEAGREKTIRRILVALDASPHSLTALKTAADLAAGLEAELLGLFIEDIHLLRLAELPFAQQVSRFSTEPVQLDRQKVEWQLRSQARQARRALESLGLKGRLRWSFRVSQGVISGELLHACLESDLVILGKSGWSHRHRLGSTARTVATQAPRKVLILPYGTRLVLPLGLVYDGSPLAQKGLTTAVEILPRQNGALVVIILATEGEGARLMQAEVIEALRDQSMQARFRWLLGANVSRLAELVKAERCGTLVLPGDSPYFSSETLVEILNRTTCPVLLVR